MARMGLRWGKAAWLALAASCAFGTFACSDEDEPDTGTDAAADAPRDTRSDVSVGSDARTDVSTSDQRDTGTTPDTTADGGARDATTDTGTPEGGNCVGGGDAARDGVSGMLVVQALRCANCHQDEPVDAGLILSGRSTTNVADAAVFPRNLTPDPATGLGCWTDQQILTAIMDGVNNRGMTLCSRMPRFSGQIDAGTAQEIVDFLRTIPAVNKDIPATTVCPPRPPPPEGGTDAGSDARADGDGGAPPSEGGVDVHIDEGTDTTPPPDAGTDAPAPDAAMPDAAPDTVAPDAGIDATIDAALDAETDVVTADADNDGG